MTTASTRRPHAQHVGKVAAEQPVDTCLAHDAAALENDHALGDVEHEIEVLLDDQHRQAMLAAQLRERRADLLHDGRLDALTRLIQQQQPWVGNERAREGEDLLLATRERAAAAVEQCFQPREGVDDALHRLRFGLARIAAPRQAQVLERAQGRQDAAALRHVADAHACAAVSGQACHVHTVHADAPAAGGQQAGQGLEQRRLAHAVVADDADRLALQHLQRHAVQHGHMAVPSAKFGDFEHDVAARRFSGGRVGWAVHGERGGSGVFHLARFPT